MKILQIWRVEQGGKLRREFYSVSRTATAIKQKIIFAELEEVTACADFLRSTQWHENYFPTRHIEHLRHNDIKKTFDTQKNL